MEGVAKLARAESRGLADLQLPGKYGLGALRWEIGLVDPTSSLRFQGLGGGKLDL